MDTATLLLEIANLLLILSPQGRAGKIAGTILKERLGRTGQRILERINRTRKPPEKSPEEPSQKPKPVEEPKTPQQILNPDGKPIGRSGNRPKYRVQEGGKQAAKDLYNELSKGGVPDTPPNYPGEGTRLPNGDWVGYRPSSKSGPPSIDLDIEGFPYNKIKFP